MPPDYCGDCYGAETEGVKCCNTCQELLDAYNAREWSTTVIMKTSSQCIRERAYAFHDVNHDEGCRGRTIDIHALYLILYLTITR